VEYDKLGEVELGFDHKSIIEYAKKRLNWKLEYTTIAKNILPKKFTLTQLQKAYETIL
jgi:8-oxo-dGTP diphosphatase